MTVAEFIQEKQMYPEHIYFKIDDIIQFLQEFALLKCAEQRAICANELVSTGSNNRSNILNSPTPEM